MFLSAVAELRVATMQGKQELIENVQVDDAGKNNQVQNTGPISSTSDASSSY